MIKKIGFILIVLILLGIVFLSNPGRVVIISQDANGTLSDTNKVSVSGNDTTPGYLSEKLQAGTNITLTIQNPGADENILISSTATGGSSDGNCDNNALCTITGKINTNIDANFHQDVNVGQDLNVHGIGYFDQNINVDKNINIPTGCIVFGNTSPFGKLCFTQIDGNAVLLWSG